MNLEDYIKWHRDLGHDGLYDKSPELADPNAVSFKHIGNVDLPDVEHVYEKSFMVHWRGGKRGYLSAYDDKLTEIKDNNSLLCLHLNINGLGNKKGTAKNDSKLER